MDNYGLFLPDPDRKKRELPLSREEQDEMHNLIATIGYKSKVGRKVSWLLLNMIDADDYDASLDGLLNEVEGVVKEVRQARWDIIERR